MSELNTRADSEPKKFSSSKLAANTAVASIGAAVAALAAIPSVPVAIGVGVIGGVIAFTATNEIPADGK